MILNSSKQLIANCFFIFIPAIFILGNTFLNIYFLIFFLLLLLFNEDVLNFYKNYKNKILIFLVFLFFYYLFLFIFVGINNYKIFSIFKFLILFLSISIYSNYMKLDLIASCWFIVLIFILIDTFIQFFTGSDIFGYPSQLLSSNFCSAKLTDPKSIFLMIEEKSSSLNECPAYKRTLRLSGPFNDEFVVGGFLINFSIVTIFISKFLKKKIKVFLLFITSVLILLSGERMAFLLSVFSIFLIIILLFKKNLFKVLIITLVILVVTIPIIVKDKRLTARYDEIKIITINYNDPNNPYFSLFFKSIEIFKENPFLGTGPRSFRDSCQKQGKNFDKSCKNHPHNIYFEILAETGIYGFLFFIWIIFNFFRKTLFCLKKQINLTHLEIGCFVSLIVLFFPFKTSGSVFSTFYGFYFWFFSIFSYICITKKNLSN